MWSYIYKLFFPVGVQFSSECQPNKLPEEEEVVQSLSDCEEQSKTDSEQDVSINWSDYQIYDFDAENTQVAVENERALAICKRKAS